MGDDQVRTEDARPSDDHLAGRQPNMGAMITGDGSIENFRRLCIRRALRFKIEKGFWLPGASGTLKAVRTYGWSGGHSKSALAFMETLGDVDEGWRRCRNKFSVDNDACECGGEWVYYEDIGGYGCFDIGYPAVPKVDGHGRRPQ